MAGDSCGGGGQSVLVAVVLPVLAPDVASDPVELEAEPLLLPVPLLPVEPAEDVPELVPVPDPVLPELVLLEGELADGTVVAGVAGSVPGWPVVP